MRTYRLVSAVILLATISSVGFPQTNVATTIGEFLLIEPSSRISGMGNAGVAYACEPMSAFYNPAAIALIPSVGLEFTHSLWLTGVSYDYAIAKMSIDASTAFMASVTSLRSGDMMVRTVEQPEGTGENFSASDLAVGIGGAMRVTDRVAVGLQVTYMQETIWHSTASAVALNIGTHYQLSEGGVAIGASLSNFGSTGQFAGRDLQVLYDPYTTQPMHGGNQVLPATVSTDSYSLPLMFRVGLSVPFHPADGFDLTLAADALHPNNNTESISVGGECTFSSLVSARLGYQNLFEQDSEVGLTAGLGILFELSGMDARLDYGWTKYGRLGDVQRVTMGISF